MGKCTLRTLCDLSEDAELKPVGKVNERVDQTHEKTIQHLRPQFLQVRSIGCEVRPEVVRRREGEMFERLSWGVILQVFCEECEVCVIIPGSGGWLTAPLQLQARIHGTHF